LLLLASLLSLCGGRIILGAGVGWRLRVHLRLIDLVDALQSRRRFRTGFLFDCLEARALLGLVELIDCLQARGFLGLRLVGDGL
jgi:hypothetical protein